MVLLESSSQKQPVTAGIGTVNHVVCLRLHGQYWLSRSTTCYIKYTVNQFRHLPVTLVIDTWFDVARLLTAPHLLGSCVVQGHGYWPLRCDVWLVPSTTLVHVRYDGKMNISVLSSMITSLFFRFPFQILTPDPEIVTSPVFWLPASLWL